MKRARNAYERAAAQGAWAPAVVLQRRVEELEAKAAAEVAAAQAAVNRDPAKLTLKLQNALRALPDSLREEVLAPFR